MSKHPACPWPKWKLKELLGEGSSGCVWRAKSSSGQECAIKLIRVPADKDWIPALREQGLSDAEIAQRMDKLVSVWCGEVRKLQSLADEPHIVRLEDYQVVVRESSLDREIWLRMELLKSLVSYLADKKLSEAEVIQLGLDLCDALSACHGRGFVHGDVKPENILVDDRNLGGVQFKLGDFGIARDLYDFSSLLPDHGSPAYMPPELASGGDPDPRGDQYALGLTLYRLMNEYRLPFLSQRRFASREEKNIALRIRLSGLALPAPCQASPEFSEIILRACAPRPGQRYPSMRHMRTELHKLQRKQNEALKHARRRKALYAACFVALTALVAAVEWVIWNKNSNSPEVNMVEARQVTSTERLTSRLRDLETVLTLGDQYIIPVHLLKVGAVAEVMDLIPAPVWQGAELDLRDDSSEWNIYVTLRDVDVTSFIYHADDGLYYCQKSEVREEMEDLFLSLGKGTSGKPTIEFQYDPRTLELLTWNINIFRDLRSVRVSVSYHPASGDSRWILRHVPKDRQPLTAVYDATGRLQRIDLGKKSFSALETLPVLEHATYLP